MTRLLDVNRAELEEREALRWDMPAAHRYVRRGVWCGRPQLLACLVWLVVSSSRCIGRGLLRVAFDLTFPPPIRSTAACSAPTSSWRAWGASPRPSPSSKPSSRPVSQCRNGVRLLWMGGGWLMSYMEWPERYMLTCPCPCSCHTHTQTTASDPCPLPYGAAPRPKETLPGEGAATGSRARASGCRRATPPWWRCSSRRRSGRAARCSTRPSRSSTGPGACICLFVCSGVWS